MYIYERVCGTVVMNVQRQKIQETPKLICFVPIFIMNFLLLFLTFSASFALMVASPSQSSVEMDVSNQTALQKHVSFFDRNKDGTIYPKETYDGFRAMGVNIALSTFAAGFIHAGLSAKTRPGEPADLNLPIVIKNINLGKHGSDTDSYDNAGRFVPSKFEEIFEKHAHTNKSFLTSGELKEMLKANKDPKDFIGWIASSVEWEILFFLCKDKNGVLQKATVRAAFDGSLFEQMAKYKA